MSVQGRSVGFYLAFAVLVLASDVDSRLHCLQGNKLLVRRRLVGI